MVDPRIKVCQGLDDVFSGQAFWNRLRHGLTANTLPFSG
jgi:hypothetical protein